VGRAVGYYFRKGLAKNTINCNEGVWKRYRKMCIEFDMAPLPVTETEAKAYVTKQAEVV